MASVNDAASDVVVNDVANGVVVNDVANGVADVSNVFADVTSNVDNFVVDEVANVVGDEVASDVDDDVANGVADVANVVSFDNIASVVANVVANVVGDEVASNVADVANVVSFDDIAGVVYFTSTLHPVLAAIQSYAAASDEISENFILTLQSQKSRCGEGEKILLSRLFVFVEETYERNNEANEVSFICLPFN